MNESVLRDTFMRHTVSLTNAHNELDELQNAVSNLTVIIADQQTTIDKLTAQIETLSSALILYISDMRNKTQTCNTLGANVGMAGESRQLD